MNHDVKNYEFEPQATLKESVQAKKEYECSPEHLQKLEWDRKNRLENDFNGDLKLLEHKVIKACMLDDKCTYLQLNFDNYMGITEYCSEYHLAVNDTMKNLFKEKGYSYYTYGKQGILFIEDLPIKERKSICCRKMLESKGSIFIELLAMYVLAYLFIQFNLTSEMTRRTAFTLNNKFLILVFIVGLHAAIRISYYGYAFYKQFEGVNLKEETDV